MNKKLLMASILSTGLTAGFLSNAVMAMPEGGDNGKPHNCKSEQRGDRDHKRGGKGMHHGRSFERGYSGLKGGKMNMMEREFTAGEIRTLVSAKLIMKGNPNIKVGTVTTVEDGYKVTIVTQDNSLVEELDLAKNSMPKERYQKMLERKAKREAMKEKRKAKRDQASTTSERSNVDFSTVVAAQ